MNIEITENNIIITNIELENIGIGIENIQEIEEIQQIEQLEKIQQENLELENIYGYKKIEECNICFEDRIILNLCKNKNCKNSICYSCYMNILHRSNNPLCPFCRIPYTNLEYSYSYYESKMMDNIDNINNNLHYNLNNNIINNNLNNNSRNGELNLIVYLNLYNVVLFKIYISLLVILCLSLIILVQLHLI